MKYAIILPDGAADEPVAELEGRTPLEAARTPHIDWIAANGRQGLVVTAPAGFAPGSDVCTLSLFGYDPRKDYDGRAPIEAAARGLPVGDGEVVFRCNFVTIHDGCMLDFTAGHISQPEADRLIADLNAKIGGETCRFFSGVSYRNLLVASPPGGFKVKCTPPHDIPDRPIKDHVPTGTGAEWIWAIMERAQAILTDHEVNLVRRDLGDNPATDIWLWGHGRPKPLESLEARFGIRGAAIAAVDLIRGIARNAGLHLIDVPGATGYLDTDYAAKGRAAVEALDEFDLVVVHVEAPDEAGHQGNAGAKVAALERIDECVVGPMIQRLRREPQWRVLVAPDHPTPVRTRVHSAAPPPFCLAGHAIQPVVRKPFSEKNALETGFLVDPGRELMTYFLRAGVA